MTTHRLAPDTPILDESADALGRGALARLIAAELMSAPVDGGMVVGLMGPWGSGKTSVLNLVENELGEEVDVVRFNPWWFSGSAELMARFFAELAATLRSSDDEELQGAADRVLAYRDAIAPILKIAFGARGEAVGDIIVGAGDARDATRPSVREEYDRLRETLSQARRRIVVFVDDIDRLTADEVREVVRLVKLVGELPHVSYVLAFDRHRVEAALDGSTGDGRAYLEKIVQVPHDVPFLAPATLRRLAIEQLSQNLDGVDLHRFDSQLWSQLFSQGIGPMLTSIRDSKRYSNIAPAAVSLVGDEVAGQDILALEALRIFEPDVYAKLPDIADALTDSAGMDWREQSTIDEERRARVDAVMDHAKRREAAGELLKALFPAAGHFFGGSRYGSSGRAWRAARRVASREVLDVYLSKAVGPDALATAEVAEIIQLLSEPPQLRERLRTVEDAQFASLLDRLRDHVDDFPEDRSGRAALVFMEIEDRLPTDGRGFFEMPGSWALHALADALVHRLPPEHRVEAVRGMVSEAPSMSIRQRIIRQFGTFPTRDRRSPDREILDEAETATAVADLAQQVVVTPAADLAGEPALPYLLASVVQQDDVAEGQAALVDKALNDDFFENTLTGCISYVNSSDGSRTPRLDWEGLVALFGDQVLCARIRELEERRGGSANDKLREALDLATLHANGEPPPDPFA